MVIELDDVVREVVSALDAMDVDRLIEGTTYDVEGIDELSRQWLRGREHVHEHLRRLSGRVSDLHTEVRDADERIWGDTGVFTCWIDRSYTLDGEEQKVSAPTTFIFRREFGEWKLAHVHSVPLA